MEVEMKTRIKITKGRRPTVEQLKQAVLLAQNRGDTVIELVTPENEVWASAQTERVAEYVKAIESVQWPFTIAARRNKVVIE
jgi:hypothetical protein